MFSAQNVVCHQEGIAPVGVQGPKLAPSALRISTKSSLFPDLLKTSVTQPTADTLNGTKARVTLRFHKPTNVDHLDRSTTKEGEGLLVWGRGGWTRLFCDVFIRLASSWVSSDSVTGFWLCREDRWAHSGGSAGGRRDMPREKNKVNVLGLER